MGVPAIPANIENDLQERIRCPTLSSSNVMRQKEYTQHLCSWSASIWQLIHGRLQIEHDELCAVTLRGNSVIETNHEHIATTDFTHNLVSHPYPWFLISLSQIKKIKSA